MQFAQLGAAGRAEVGYGVWKNAQGATITTGYPIAICTTANSNTGYEVVLPASLNLFTFAGIAASDVPNATEGRFITYGYAQSVLIDKHASSVTIGLGVVMGISTVPANGVLSTGFLDTYGPVLNMVSAGAAICSPGGYTSGWVRAL